MNIRCINLQHYSRLIIDPDSKKSINISKIKSKFLSVCFMVTLVSCTHIPISTMVKMSSFDGHDFAELEPDEIRIKVLTVGPPGIRSDSAEMSGQIYSTERSLEYKFVLENYDSKVVTVNGGLFSKDRLGTEVYFRLSKQDLKQFGEIQQRVGVMGKSKFTYNVNSTFKADRMFNGKVSDAYFSVFLQLKETEGYIKILDEMNFNHK